MKAWGSYGHAMLRSLIGTHLLKESHLCLTNTTGSPFRSRGDQHQLRKLGLTHLPRCPTLDKAPPPIHARSLSSPTIVSEWFYECQYIQAVSVRIVG